MSESAPGPKKLSPTHKAIADWLLQNPGSKRMAECATAFGVSRAWLSTVIHSDAFQAHLLELQERADLAVIHDIPAKLRGVASMAIDGLASAVEKAMDDNTPILHREFLAETVDMTLTRLGYGAAKPAQVSPFPGIGAQQNNFYLGTVDAKTLAGARELLLNGKPPVEVPTELSETRQLPASIERDEGGVQR